MWTRTPITRPARLERIPALRQHQIMISRITRRASIRSSRLVKTFSRQFPIKLRPVIKDDSRRPLERGELHFAFVDFQKTTCFTQTNQPNRNPTTQQPRRSTSSAGRSNPVSPATPSAPVNPQEGSAAFNGPSIPTPSSSNTQSSRSRDQFTPSHHRDDCDCSDDEMNEISEKRQSIFDGNPGPSGCSSQVKAKVTNSSSSDSSSFEEVEDSAVKISDDHWQIIEKTASNGIHTVEQPSIDEVHMNVAPSPNQMLLPEPIANPEVRRLTRRRSDSSLLSLRKSNSITIDASSFDPSQSGSEVKKLKISCNKCGKAKSNIKREILKLSEQLKSSKRSEAEVNAKIKEFLDYLESKSQPSEMTETDDSQLNPEDGARFIPTSSSHDEIEENIFDENEGINVYPSMDEHEASSSTPRRFISLDDIHSRWENWFLPKLCWLSWIFSDELELLTVKQLKEILMLNRVDFKGCCEKKELKERVQRLWHDHLAAPRKFPSNPAIRWLKNSFPASEKLPTDDLCKICMDAPIECVFLECGHMATCTACGKVLNECPICRQFIVRVVRIFKS